MRGRTVRGQTIRRKPPGEVQGTSPEEPYVAVFVVDLMRCGVMLCGRDGCSQQSPCCREGAAAPDPQAQNPDFGAPAAASRVCACLILIVEQATFRLLVHKNATSSSCSSLPHAILSSCIGHQLPGLSLLYSMHQWTSEPLLTMQVLSFVPPWWPYVQLFIIQRIKMVVFGHTVLFDMKRH